MDIQTLTDAQLIQRVTKLDARIYVDGPDNPDPDGELAEELSLAEQECNRRFGTDAMDVLASYWTASHAGSDDRVSQAMEDPQTLVEIAKGTHVHQSQGQFGSCKCGVLAQFIK